MHTATDRVVVSCADSWVRGDMLSVFFFVMHVTTLCCVEKRRGKETRGVYGNFKLALLHSSAPALQNFLLLDWLYSSGKAYSADPSICGTIFE